MMEVTIKYNGCWTVVKVSDEVYECMKAGKNKAENLLHERRRHWDAREFDEYIVATEGRFGYQATPEELVCQKETRDELLAILQTCTEIQGESFLLYVLYGLSKGTMCLESRYGASRLCLHKKYDIMVSTYERRYQNGKRATSTGYK